MAVSRLDPRIAYAIATLFVIAIGLLTRLPLLQLPWGLAKPLGSVLWGAMVYCIIRCWQPSLPMSASAAIATLIAACVEFSQLWHAGWLDAFRRTTIGVLLIGRYFAWADIAAYVAGIVVAGLIDRRKVRW